MQQCRVWAMAEQDEEGKRRRETEEQGFRFPQEFLAYVATREILIGRMATGTLLTKPSGSKARAVSRPLRLKIFLTHRVTTSFDM